MHPCTESDVQCMLDQIQARATVSGSGLGRQRHVDALKDMQYSPNAGPGFSPSGPRRQGEGIEEDEQGIVSAVVGSDGSIKVRVTLLAAGFLIGPSGASVRDMSRQAGCDIRSWNETVRSQGKLRKVRTLVVSGPHASVMVALQIICRAVERYKDLCEGKFCGHSVDRVQWICGVEFYYQPPPRQAVPYAATLRTDAERIPSFLYPPASGLGPPHPFTPPSLAQAQAQLHARPSHLAPSFWPEGEQSPGSGSALDERLLEPVGQSPMRAPGAGPHLPRTPFSVPCAHPPGRLGPFKRGDAAEMLAASPFYPARGLGAASLAPTPTSSSSSVGEAAHVFPGLLGGSLEQREASQSSVLEPERGPGVRRNLSAGSPTVEGLMAEPGMSCTLAQGRRPPAPLSAPDLLRYLQTLAHDRSGAEEGAPERPGAEGARSPRGGDAAIVPGAVLGGGTQGEEGSHQASRSALRSQSPPSHASEAPSPHAYSLWGR